MHALPAQKGIENGKAAAGRTPEKLVREVPVDKERVGRPNLAHVLRLSLLTAFVAAVLRLGRGLLVVRALEDRIAARREGVEDALNFLVRQRALLRDLLRACILVMHDRLNMRAAARSPARAFLTAAHRASGATPACGKNAWSTLRANLREILQGFQALM